MSRETLDRLCAVRLGEITSPSGRLRVLLLTVGVAAGMCAVTAAITIGRGSSTLFSDLARVVTEPDRFQIEPTGARFAPRVLDSLQARVPDARLCPIMEATGKVPELGGTHVRVLGLDLLGDPRVPLVAGALDAKELRRLVVPTVYVPRRILDAGTLSPDEAVEVRVDDRSETFIVAPVPLPDELTARSSGAVVAVDVSHFQEAFRPDGGIDRIAVVAASAEASRRAEARIADELPSGARILALGSGSDIARGWVAMWRRTGTLLVSVAFLLGIVIVYLAVTAAYARLAPVSRRLVTDGVDARWVGLSEIIEVTGTAVVASAVGTFNGWLIADGIATWVIGLGPWEAVTPIAGGRPPLLPILAAFVMGAGVPTLFAFLSRAEHPDGSEVMITVPRAPAAIAGVLFVLASMLSIPGAGHGGLVLGYAAGLLVCIGIGLLGRPFLALAGSALRRRAAARWPIGARVVAAQLLECPTVLGVSLAFVTFTIATTTAMWSVSGHLESMNDAWLARTFGPDLRVEAPGDVESATRFIPADLAQSIRQRPEVESVEVVRRVAATLGGSTLPLECVSPAHIEELRIRRSVSAEALERAASASPPAVPLYMPEETARAYGLFAGAGTWIDTATGSWPCLLAGTYEPTLGAPATCFVDATRFLSRLTDGERVNALDVRLRGDVEPHEGRDAILAAVGPDVPLRVRPLDLSRPHLERAFEIAQRTVMLLLSVLSALAGIAFLSFAGGALADIPPAWRVMAALGVPRRRIATSAAVGLTALGLVALVTGSVTGTIAGSALTGAVGEPWVGVLQGVRAATTVWLASATAWLLASGLVFIALRSRSFARAMGGPVS